MYIIPQRFRNVIQNGYQTCMEETEIWRSGRGSTKGGWGSFPPPPKLGSVGIWTTFKGMLVKHHLPTNLIIFQ